MKTIFVDTAHWIARSNRRDQWHQAARALISQLGDAQFVTTELVLVEYLNYFSEFGETMREKVAVTAEAILTAPNTRIVWQTRSLFEAGLTLYTARLDKGYSLTDCVSMIVMRQKGIQEVLTHDRHFFKKGSRLSSKAVGKLMSQGGYYSIFQAAIDEIFYFFTKNFYSSR